MISAQSGQESAVPLGMVVLEGGDQSPLLMDLMGECSAQVGGRAL